MNPKELKQIIREEIAKALESIDREFQTTGGASEHPNPQDLSVEEIEDYIASNPKTLWGRDLRMWKMVLSQKKDEGSSQINEELYDFVRDIKGAMGKGNKLYSIENYLGRELSYEEKSALISAGVMQGYNSSQGHNRNRRY